MKTEIETFNCTLISQTVNILTRYQIVSGIGGDTAYAEVGPIVRKNLRKKALVKK